jgi:hypothetical protein
MQQHRIGAIPGATDPRIDEIPPNAEIAQALGCRPATVRSLVHRGLASLRKVIAQ